MSVRNRYPSLIHLSDRNLQSPQRLDERKQALSGTAPSPKLAADQIRIVRQRTCKQPIPKKEVDRRESQLLFQKLHRL